MVKRVSNCTFHHFESLTVAYRERTIFIIIIIKSCAGYYFGNERRKRQSDKRRPKTPIPRRKRRSFRLLFRRGAIIHHRQWKRFGRIGESPTVLIVGFQIFDANLSIETATTCQRHVQRFHYLSQFSTKIVFSFSGKTD